MIIRFFDLETTDLIHGSVFPQIIQYAFVTWQDGALIDVRQRFVQPTIPVEPGAAKANGYTPELWANYGATPLNQTDVSIFHELLGKQFVGGQNVVAFDLPILAAECNRLGFAAPVHDYHVTDTMPLGMVLQCLGLVSSCSLKPVSEYLKVQDKLPAWAYARKAHDAVYDAAVSALVYNEFVGAYADQFLARAAA